MWPSEVETMVGFWRSTHTAHSTQHTAHSTQTAHSTHSTLHKHTSLTKPCQAKVKKTHALPSKGLARVTKRARLADANLADRRFFHELLLLLLLLLLLFLLLFLLLL